jgi:2-oxoglutarate ferredoxin oxidoreductase subunit alpha
LDANIRICGEAGQGVQTTGNLLIGALAAGGLHVLGSQSYMSRIRGGANSFDIRISDAELFAPRESADLMVALTAEALEHFRAGAGGRALVIFDGDSGADGVLGLPLSAAAREAGGSALMVNTVAAGAVMRFLGYGIDGLRELLSARFAKKGADVVARNAACAERGAELVAGREGSVPAPRPARPSGEVISGSQAVGLGAAVSGVKLVASYPMTPSTGVFTFLAGHADEYGIVVEQAEDEIAAINMVCGATYAGVPAMTTTSGGGFALMCEGLSLAGMLELPVVVMDSQRPGPATGLPTRTGQEDLKMVVNAGHGEFPRAVFAPGTHRQCYDLVRRALETAHRFQTPAVLMIDQFLADIQKNVEPLPAAPDPLDRCLELEPPADYRRYAITESGVSPRAIPGSGPFVLADSDEHTEDGHITEDLAARVRLQDKRLRKLGGMLAEVLEPEVYPQPAGEVLLSWGSSYGPCREAVDLLRAAGREISVVHFSQVWPISPGSARRHLEGRRVFAVEGNATAQFAGLLRAAGALGDFEPLLRYDGLPFTAEAIAGRVAG